MFTQRDFFARDSILERQEILYDAIKNLNSTTFLEKKANAIAYTKLIDPIITLKIKKQLPQINYIINNEQELYNETKKKQIYDLILNTNIERGDVMRLPLKKYIPKYKPTPIPDYPIQPNVSPYIMFSLHDFEQLLFNGKSKFKYYADTKISDYIYLNILEMLDVEHADELEHRPEWQAKLATFIRQTNFEPYYTKLAFQMDVVKYKGILIDVSFVPKLDIEAIAPIKNNFNDMDNDILIKYRDNLDVNSNKLIPVEYITIFLTFPFKDGFYISPDGRLHYLDFPKTQNMSAMKMIESIDIHHNFEGSLEDLSRNLHVDELQKIAIYSKDIHLQGLALLALRHMLGDIISFGPYRVQMPTIDAVLRWINYTNYTKKQLILPILAETMTMYTNIRLVRDIAKSCSTKRGAAFICSHYFIPECDYAAVWRNCTNNAEKYVLLTLILQEYNIYHFKKYRDSLQDIYFQSDPFPYENYNIGARVYINKDLSQKIQNNQIEMIKSTDIIKNLECNPDTCLEYYQFTNPQLAELADNGATQLDDDQYSAFLSLCI